MLYISYFIVLFIFDLNINQVEKLQIVQVRIVLAAVVCLQDEMDF